MAKRARSKRRSPQGGAVTEGNFISEWFGQRIFPAIRADSSSIGVFGSSSCPFLSKVLATDAKCVKRENSLGVCTINAASNGPRQDWLACPFRVISSEIVQAACEKIFALPGRCSPVPVSLLQAEGDLRAFKQTVTKEGAAYFYFQDKLGGEISVLGTPSSPEVAFDVTIAEVRRHGSEFRVSRFGILEIQTMDFHGSYKAAVSNLRDGLRLHRTKFLQALAENSDWSGAEIEGPNIANVFKRTFYQVLLKFQLGGKGPCAGTVLAIPQSVWDSWQPFLGKPPIAKGRDGSRIVGGTAKSVESWPNAHICVFDLQSDAKSPVSPVEIKEFLRVSPPRMASFAFSKVPRSMLKSIRGGSGILETIKERISKYWPDLSIGTQD